MLRFSIQRSTRYFSTSIPRQQQHLTDVAIIGAGPAGLSLAAALKANPTTKSLSVGLIEGSSLDPVKNFSQSPPENFTNRVSSITAQSVDYLEHIGAWKFIDQARIEPFDNIVAYDGLSNSRIEFDNMEMGTMCENINLQSCLLQRIEELNDPTLKIWDSTKVTNIANDTDDAANGWPVIQLSNGDSVKTRLLVGADGFNSPVRKFAAIESRGWAYDRFGVVASLKLKYEDYRSIAWQRFLPTGPVALLPLPEKNATMVWSTTPELSKLLVGLPEDVFIALANCAFVLPQVDLNYYYTLAQNEEYDELLSDIKWRFENYTSKPTIDIEDFPIALESVIPQSRARFPLKLSHADSYVSNRVALVGDAAHTTHPLAGQGLNMGQGDVKSLVESLELAMKRGLDIGNLLALEPYWAQRWPENHVLLGVVDKLHKLYSIDWSPVVAVRSWGLDVVNSLPMLKDFMMKQVSGK
ncbi:putative N,N-dimethylaniline monooxygenase [Saccharomycopsis crataegensis]|uniref:Ubiquinone biosynthesis monooxygenase COQ6, mitochondrial n=1 Tax=Saccharomycopsis crataegensis TaxID=43959 RepID=A0AAV5QQH3_9ASCO|nr:putative N,N-dimethylaniline monooxygenase [Saccharomycopsis crataegensis]